MKTIVHHEHFPYRYVECGILEINDEPDYRIQKYNQYSDRYQNMYYCDNRMQFDTAIEDFEYTKWLDPDPEVASYPRKSDTIKSPYES